MNRIRPSARILAAAGVDGVELHGHEGYLFDQFTTALWNKRTDKYGGTLEGRLRLPIEVLKEIKEKAGPDFPVQYRFGLKHYVKALNSGALPGEPFIEAGRDVEEGLQMARMLEAAGFDSLHVDAGCYDSWYWPHPPVYQKPGLMADMAAAVKKVVRIPVIAVGKLSIPEVAERIIAEGQADIVALGKGLLADAFWVKKVILVEILKDLLIGGLPVQHMNRLMLLDLLKFHKVEVLTHMSLLEVLEDGALLIDHELRRRYSSADGIVVAVGLKPERGLYQALRNQTPNLYLIGDSRNPQNVMNAVWDAYEIGRMI